MRREVLSCDTCCIEYSFIPIAPIPPTNWYMLDKVGDSTARDLHFCSLKCLYEWVIKYMELKNDMDVVFDKLEKDKSEKVTPSDPEYWVRFDERNSSQ